MAEDEYILNYANALKNTIAGISDLGIPNESHYLYTIPQMFKLPCVFIEEESADIVRQSSKQAQFRVVFRVSIFLRNWTNNSRVEESLKKLSTLMRRLMKKPDLGANVILVDVSDGRVGELELPGRDQVCEGLSVRVTIADEPVDVTPE